MAHAGEEGRHPTSEKRLTSFTSAASIMVIVAWDDPALVESWWPGRSLDPCPLSQPGIEGDRNLSDHPVKIMLDRGLLATIH